MNLKAILPISLDQFVMMGVTLGALVVFCYFTGISLIIPFLVFLFGVYLFLSKKANVRLFLHLIFLLVLLMFGVHVLKAYPMLSHFYLAVACIPMLTILLFGEIQLAFLMAFMSCAISGLMMDFSLTEMLIFFMGSMAGVFALKNARTRSVVLRAGLWVAIIQAALFILINPSMDLTVALTVLKPFAINGILSGIIVMSTLKMFESLYGEVSNFTLLELSDSSHPLLKRMLTEAPGTYHHSMIVSNLAEAAADAIGANALLVRVGAYFHDIGKISKPQYFTENQIQTGNKHDHLEPSMSRLVILNHVKEGLELAQEFRLSPKIVEFIPQHHGTSLMHFFYQKAIAESGGQELDENEYRYPGPKPQNKETAIVMLADSAEGATRSLSDHAPHQVEDMVRKVINNKFIDGQLDECNLTLREINTIAITFTRLLSAMYHNRVAYPQTKK